MSVEVALSLKCELAPLAKYDQGTTSWKSFMLTIPPNHC